MSFWVVTYQYFSVGSQLAAQKPTDPNAFLIQEISKILAARSRDQKLSTFNEKDINSLFSVFDLTNRGYLTREWYNQALQYVGVTEPKFSAGAAQMDKTTFVKAVLAELQPLSIWIAKTDILKRSILAVRNLWRLLVLS